MQTMKEEQKYVMKMYTNKNSRLVMYVYNSHTHIKENGENKRSSSGGDKLFELSNANIKKYTLKI